METLRYSTAAAPRPCNAWRARLSLSVAPSVAQTGGKARRAVTVTAAAADPTDVFVELFDALPKKKRKLLFTYVSGLQAQVVAMTNEMAAKANEVAAKANEVAAKSNEKADIALQLAAKTEELYKTKQMLLQALSIAGVVNARTFLEELIKIWTKGKTYPSNKRDDILKVELEQRPELVKCLRQEVPSWVRPDMSDDKAVASMARNLEAIMKNASMDIHTFDEVTGLFIYKTALNGPTVAALICLAEHAGVPYRIVTEAVKNDTAVVQDKGAANSA